MKYVNPFSSQIISVQNMSEVGKYMDELTDGDIVVDSSNGATYVYSSSKFYEIKSNIEYNFDRFSSTVPKSLYGISYIKHYINQYGRHNK